MRRPSIALRGRRRLSAWRTMLLVGALLVGTLSAGGATAADPAHLGRFVLGSSGPRVSAGEFRLMGSTGEAIVAPISTTGDFHLGSGYWAKLPRGGTLFLPHLDH